MGFRHTPPAMRFRALACQANRCGRRALPAVLLVALPVLAMAQTPFESPSGARNRLRDTGRSTSSQSTAKLDENLRKVKADDLPTRLEGIRGLGELTDAKATEQLIALANDPDMVVRVKAIDTLGQTKAKDATPLLVQQLFMRDTDGPTKRRILAALGKIGDPRATSPILDVLARDHDQAVRGNAIFALGDIGDRSAIAPLEKFSATEQDATLRALAQDAIRKIREKPEPEVVPPALAVDRRGPERPATP